MTIHQSQNLRHGSSAVSRFIPLVLAVEAGAVQRFTRAAAIDVETKLILDVALFGSHGTDLAASFLAGLREKHDFSEAEFLVDQFSYRTAIV